MPSDEELQALAEETGQASPAEAQPGSGKSGKPYDPSLPFTVIKRSGSSPARGKSGKPFDPSLPSTLIKRGGGAAAKAPAFAVPSRPMQALDPGAPKISKHDRMMTAADRGQELQAAADQSAAQIQKQREESVQVGDRGPIEELNRPLVNIPYGSPEDYQSVLGLSPGAAQAASGLNQGLARVAEGFTSPIGVATLGAGALESAVGKATTAEILALRAKGMQASADALQTRALGEAAKSAAMHRKISGLFAGQMAGDLPEQAGRFGTALGAGDTEGAVREGTGLVGTGYFARAAGRHALDIQPTPKPPAQALAEMLDQNVRNADVDPRTYDLQAMQLPAQRAGPPISGDAPESTGPSMSGDVTPPNVGEEVESVQRGGPPIEEGVEAEAAPAGAEPEGQPATAPDGNPITSQEQTHEAALNDLGEFPIRPVPLSEIKLSKDVPNFKEDSDPATGEVRGQELGGKFDKLGTGPIVLWRRKNGDLEVISGRHRLALARRSGETDIRSQIVDESAGFTLPMAMSLDAALNIREGQGTTRDYVKFFNNSEISREAAQMGGLLARAKGKTGWAIGKDASPDVLALYKAEKLSEAKAAAIAQAAPGNHDLQRVGLRAAQDGATPAEITARMEAASAAGKGRATRASQSDFFSDTALDEQWKQQGQYVAAARKRLQDIISTRKTILNKFEAATGTGSIGADAAKAQAEHDAAVAQLKRWENWAQDPELRAEVEAGGKPKVEAKKPGPMGQRFRPSCAPGQKRGDVLSGQTEDFKLAGEKAKGVEEERLRKEKEQADQDRKESEKDQGSLLSPDIESQLQNPRMID